MKLELSLQRILLSGEWASFLLAPLLISIVKGTALFGNVASRFCVGSHDLGYLLFLIYCFIFFTRSWYSDSLSNVLGSSIRLYASSSPSAEYWHIPFMAGSRLRHRGYSYGI